MIEQDYMELGPAYGRDYNSALKVRAAFEAGNDFIGDYSVGFKLISVRDFKPGAQVLLRYKELSRVVVHTVGGSV